MNAVTARTSLTRDVQVSLLAAFAGARRERSPFPHWELSGVLPVGFSETLRGLPFPAPDLGGVSGKRELHNDQRHYFDAANRARFPICTAVAEAFQSREVVEAIEAQTGARLEGTYVRLEYAQDIDGFWLEPHTDLGVKRFTMLLYLTPDPGQADLGTDLYERPGVWARRSRFVDNCAVVFVPGDNTWHGLERRAISGVRRSLIMNYVTEDWRAREQLAYPENPIGA